MCEEIYLANAVGFEINLPLSEIHCRIKEYATSRSDVAPRLGYGILAERNSIIHAFGTVIISAELSFHE